MSHSNDNDVVEEIPAAIKELGDAIRKIIAEMGEYKDLVAHYNQLIDERAVTALDLLNDLVQECIADVKNTDQKAHEAERLKRKFLKKIERYLD